MNPKQIIDEYLAPLLDQLPAGVKVVCVVVSDDKLNIMSTTNKHMTTEMLAGALAGVMIDEPTVNKVPRGSFNS